MRTVIVMFAVSVLSFFGWAADANGAGTGSAVELKSSTIARQALSVGDIDAITIPRGLSYQGKLTDTLGIPVPDTTYSVSFRLYTVPNGGTPFWTETQAVRTKEGLFSVLLGSVTAVDSVPQAGGLYLAMAVGGGAELAPRLRIVSAAYSFCADNAARLDGNDLAGLDARYVNEGQANSVTSAMITDGAVQTADIADIAITSAKIGNGEVTMAKINQSGATTGQVIKWNGSSWTPANDSVGVSGGGTVTSISQATGVVCTPNPITTTGTVRFDSTWGDSRYVNEGQANSVTSAMITDGAVGNADIAGSAVTGDKIQDGTVSSADIRDTTVITADIKDGAVTSAKIADGTITAADLNQMGAASGQVLKWTGSAWAPRNDSIGQGDNAWVRGTPDSVLYTIRRLGIARGGSDNVLYGDYRYTHTNLGVACTTGTSGQNYSYCTVGGGVYSSASGSGATVGGGYDNKASDIYATVGGGYDNKASDIYATVGGGHHNDASASHATVGGGRENTASAAYAAVGGGIYNCASGIRATVGGGYADTVKAVYGGILSGYINLAGDGAADTAATVAGGYGNAATAGYAFVGGGKWNTAGAPDATVGGGNGNTADDWNATVGGGFENTAGGIYTTVGGGALNCASGDHATVAGGSRDTASSIYATVGGGYDNMAGGIYTTVGGGYVNTASGAYATVGGGASNCASGDDATVAGGYGDTAAANYGFATNSRSMVPSSYSNSAAFNGQTATAANQLRCGTLSKAGGSFTIDHPLDPYGRILNHYFIEGPEMLNIYRGSVVLDATGRAEVRLPEYFSALNRNPHIQLTGVGSSDVYVADKISGNRFVIGGKPGMEVYWQVTGERQDVSAEAIRRMMPVEQPKTGELAGRMLDDDFLAGCMEQLEREGKAQGLNFRTAEGRRRYEQFKNPPVPESIEPERLR